MMIVMCSCNIEKSFWEVAATIKAAGTRLLTYTVSADGQTSKSRAPEAEVQEQDVGRGAPILDVRSFSSITPRIACDKGLHVLKG